jgi:hypothetical protein
MRFSLGSKWVWAAISLPVPIGAGTSWSPEPAQTCSAVTAGRQSRFRQGVPSHFMPVWNSPIKHKVYVQSLKKWELQKRRRRIMCCSYANACLEICEVFRNASSHKMRPHCFCIFVSVVLYLRNTEQRFEITVLARILRILYITYLCTIWKPHSFQIRFRVTFVKARTNLEGTS